MTGPADVFLLDLDTTFNKPLYEPRLARGEKVFLYPHGPNTAWLYDGCMEADERVTAHFVVADGVRELYRRIGVTVPAYTIGFPWCDLRPFRPSAPPRKVLFAPDHPLGDGFIRPEYAERNRRVFEALLELDVELTVRHIMEVERNGLYAADGVRFVEAQPDNGTAEIDAADAVVAVGTFAALAVARGVPTIMFDQSEPPENDNPDGTRWVPASWHSWSDSSRYPYDFSDAPLGELLTDAAASDDGVREWRARFIGEPFDGAAFAKLLGELGRDPLLESELRDHVVVAWADEIAERPQLLADYARRFAGDERTTLVLYAPDADEDTTIAAVEAAIEASGLDGADVPDMLLTVLARHEVHERAMAARAFALLTGRANSGPLAALPCALALGPVPATAEAA